MAVFYVAKLVSQGWLLVIKQTKFVEADLFFTVQNKIQLNSNWMVTAWPNEWFSIVNLRECFTALQNIVQTLQFRLEGYSLQCTDKFVNS